MGGRFFFTRVCCVVLECACSLSRTARLQPRLKAHRQAIPTGRFILPFLQVRSSRQLLNLSSDLTPGTRSEKWLLFFVCLPARLGRTQVAPSSSPTKWASRGIALCSWPTVRLLPWVVRCACECIVQVPCKCVSFHGEQPQRILRRLRCPFFLESGIIVPLHYERPWNPSSHSVYQGVANGATAGEGRG